MYMDIFVPVIVFLSHFLLHMNKYIYNWEFIYIYMIFLWLISIHFYYHHLLIDTEGFLPLLMLLPYYSIIT